MPALHSPPVAGSPQAMRSGVLLKGELEGVSYVALRYSSANIYPLRVLYPFGFFL